MVAYVIVALGALAAGFVSGLAGFGTGLTALGVWLHVVSPKVAAVLVVVCSVVAQIQGLHSVRRGIEPARMWPFVAGGLAGVPVGVVALRVVDPGVLKAALGAFLVVYCSMMLRVRRFPVVRRGGRPADGAVGFAGGVLGGLAGLSGVLVTIWCGLRGWSALEQRAVYQPYNLAILGFALVAYAIGGVLTRESGLFVLCAVPATVTGAQLGLRAYGRLDERQFRRIVLGVLLVSGVVLVASHV